MIPPHDIEVTTGHTEDDPLDLTTAMPPGGPVLTPSEYAELNGRLTILEAGGGGGGGSIEYFADTLGTNMSLTSSNVYYTICNVNIPSGTWFVTGFITQVRNATTAETIYGQITRDLPSLVAVAYQRSYHPSANPSGCALSMSAIVSTTDSSTALELKVATSAGSSSSIAWAQSGAGCQLIAIRLA